ncbi:sensor histidine kinase [Rhodopseudomonas palustris]|uniref:histidine kinase n=1 Tax=Rhodopseudomonas palustris (strain BisB18) TaxID=316056 RepID=Q215N5_RHOPB
MTRQSSPANSQDSTELDFHGEADYRIAKSLTMISSIARLQAFKGAPADPQIVLLETANRIDAVAGLHNLLACSRTGTIQLSKYLEDICERSVRALCSVSTSYTVTCAPEHVVPFRLALPLGLITAELLSNSVKYSHPAGLPARITISCRRATRDSLTYRYQDDGVGFPENFDVGRDGHVGMRLIKSLSERSRGSHHWSSGPLGISFEMVAPMAA